MKTFDPMQDVPKTNEQAEVALRHEKDQLVGDNMVGIFRCQIALGDDLLVAYKTAVSHLTEKSKHPRDDREYSFEDTAQVIIKSIVGAGVALAIGWIVHLFM